MGIIIEGERRRCRIYDNDRLAKSDSGVGTILHVVVDDPEDGGKDEMMLEVHARDWCIGVRRRAARRKMTAGMSDETVQSILGGRRFRELDIETQNEVLDYVVEHIMADRRKGRGLFMDHSQSMKTLLLVVEDDMLVGGER